MFSNSANVLPWSILALEQRIYNVCRDQGLLEAGDDCFGNQRLILFLFILFFANMQIRSNISEMTIKSVISSEQHQGMAPHQSPLTVLQDILYKIVWKLQNI